MKRNEYVRSNEGYSVMNIPILFVLGCFILLILTMSFTGAAVVALPISATIAILLSRETDYFGLLLCVLIPLSFSYYYQVGQVPQIVLTTRLGLLGLFLVIGFKGGRIKSEYELITWILVAFFISAAGGSYAYSMFPQISGLKLLFCGLFFLGLIVCTRSSAEFPFVLFSIILGIIFTSLVVYLISPNIGYAFFQDFRAAGVELGKYSGILNHPQLLACLLAVNLPLMLFTYLTKKGFLSNIALAGIIGVGLLILISSSRTGLLTATITTISTVFLINRFSRSQMIKNRIRLVMVVACFVFTGLLAFSMEGLKVFIFKTQDIEAGISLSGREEIVAASWQGFLARPAFGNGFQVPSDFTEHGSEGFGITSDNTTIEKCFFVTMLLEETGLIGTILFLGVIVWLMRYWYKKRAFVALAALVGLLTINLGESCILSPSSIGGLCWLSIFAAHNLRLTEDFVHS